MIGGEGKTKRLCWKVSLADETSEAAHFSLSGTPGVNPGAIRGNPGQSGVNLWPIRGQPKQIQINKFPKNIAGSIWSVHI